MKKNLLISLTGAALLTIGSVNLSTNTTTTVNAAVVKVGKHSKLQHNAYIYNSKGERVDKSVIKHGKSVKILGKKTIKGKHYVRIGKNRYVKAKNFSKSSTKKNAKLKHNVYVVNSQGKRVNRVTLNKGKKVTILGSRTIHGKKYYRIGKNRYIKASSVTRAIPTQPSKNNSANVIENNTANNNSTTSTNTQNTNSTTNNVTPSITTPDNNTSSSSNTSSLGPVETSSNDTESNSNTSSTTTNGDSTSSDPVETPSKDNKADNNKSQQPSTDKPSNDKTDDKTDSSKSGKTDNNKPNKPGKKDDQGTSSVAKQVADENSKLEKTPVEDSTLHAATIYDENGNHVPGMYLEEHALVTKNGCKLINGQKYYKITISDSYADSHVTPYNVEYPDFYVNSTVFDPNGKSDAPNHADKEADQGFSDFMDKMFYVDQLINKKHPNIYNQYHSLFLYLAQFDHFSDDAVSATSYRYQTKADYEGLEAKADKLTKDILGKTVMEVKISQEVIDDLQKEANK